MKPLFCLIVCMLGGCAPPSPPALEIATTTSVQNSGLLSHLLAAFEQQRGNDIRVHATGSGRALRMLDQGQVAAVISHAPAAEEEMLARHADWRYQKIAFNTFVVAGPRGDPAGVASAADIIDAFRRIHESGASFVSRGDESGTHERERAFWTAAGRQPGGSQLIVSGRGMAQALRHANEAQAYVLTDEPTFRQLSGSLDLMILFDRDVRLLNSYAVISAPGHEEAEAFVAWLTGEGGRSELGGFRIEGRPAFEPWPANCPGRKPADVPCR